MLVVWLMVFLLLAVAVVVLLFRRRLRMALPQVEGTVRIPGLRAEVEVIRDRWGVAHIYAADLEDLCFAQGYVQAQDRLWQLEQNRRLARGRLAEIFGKAAVDVDRFVRTVGIGRSAERDLECLSEESNRLLSAYARGVNTYVESNPGKLPIEFALIGFRPQAWEVVDTLAWMKMQAWYLSANWSTEILNAAIAGKVGPERASRLYGGYPEDNPIVLADQNLIPIAEKALESFRSLRSWLPADALAGCSNCWAVRGRRSQSGKALLAYDPHLGLTVPSIWYACHLHAPGFEVSGATFPGVPGVIVGHNRDISFGFTNAFSDVQDLYLERFHPGGSLEYEHNGKWIRAERIVEQIRVKGQSRALPLEVMVTRHGPIVGDLLSIRPEEQTHRLALRWAGHEAADLFPAVIAMDRARDWPEFCAAMSIWDTPSQNAVYADRKGNIGYVLNGKIPVRRNGIGLVPSPGWNDDHEWSGWIPWDQMPRVLNPGNGYVVSANNQIVGLEYPHYLGLGTANGNRAARIEELIKAKPKLSLDDFARMQVDLHSRPARRFAALVSTLAGGILEQKPLSEMGDQAAAALGLLKGWQGELKADSAAAAVYTVCEYYAKRRVFEPWLGELSDFYCGSGINAFSSISHYMDYSHLMLLDVLEQDDGAWLGTPEGTRRSREQVLAAALRDALSYLSRRCGADPRRWRYGDFHKARLIHPIGRRWPFHLLFNPKPVPYGGSADTIWQCPPLRSVPPDEATYSASWRHLVDFADLDSARWVYSGGQSGHPASRHYQDLLRLWSTGGYAPMPWSRERVEAEADARLLLEPAGGKGI